ncbi:MAG: acyltransferase family protein [Aeromicrobium sp.]
MTKLDNNTATSPGAAAERFAYLDNARYWVMLLVVIGHTLTPFLDTDAARGIWAFIYAFHVPAFVFLSGYAARNFRGKPHQLRRMVGTLVIPFLIIETTLQLITRHYTGEPDPMKVLSPQWLGWFLTALVVWRLTTPLWRAMKYPITVSILISLLVPLTEVPNVLALPKVLGFLPFYVAGMYMNQERFERLCQARVRIAGVLTLAVAFAISNQIAPDRIASWLFWRHRYGEAPLSATAVEGIWQRSQLLAVGFLLTFAALSLVSHKRSWTTAYGERTLYVYLLHGYVILLLEHEFGLFDRLLDDGLPAVIGCTIGAVIVANLLMTPVVRMIFRPIFEPNLNWLFWPDSHDKPESENRPPSQPDDAKAPDTTSTSDETSTKPG